jgi:hypothetical protein
MDYKQDRIGQDKILKTKQDFKNRTGHIQTITFKKSVYLKLPNACTTMPRNIVASKTAVRPLNTSKDKTITVLTP